MAGRGRHGGWLAAVTSVVAVAGCGVAGVAGPGSTTGSTAAHDGGPPTTLPFVRQGPAEFTDRAQHIATTLRASGALERYANSLVMTSSRVQWGDYGNRGELKAVLGNGAFQAGPAVTDTPGKGQVRFADGRILAVELMGARTTLSESKKGLRGDCFAVDGAPCPIVMTSVKLVTMRVSTNQGPADVPAWEFTAKELVGPHVVVAVDEAALPDLPDPVYSSASWPRTLFGAGWLVAVGGSSVTVEMDFGSCERDWAAHVYEVEDVVVVGGSVQPLDLPPGGGCAGVGYEAPATVVLDKPLGARPVVDVAWGRVLTPRPQL